MRNSKRYGHYLNGDDPNLVIRILGFDTRSRIKFIEEVRVRVEADSDSMDENNGKLCC